jgi:hypothetical protein
MNIINSSVALKRLNSHMKFSALQEKTFNYFYLLISGHRNEKCGRHHVTVPLFTTTRQPGIRKRLTDSLLNYAGSSIKTSLKL